ncbi:fibroblast growth factor receptor substrate 2 [Sitophilus oryzae]|uniref:Fibroblast growth factor receptor substrate 2 n=1 Tax=Sitophilus oryzae TaxID=7048 RepID=A0A6J2XXS8_SITOR|nr:fibroblast growth factor receptor substrate 2 [Sitophilus oryzae]XP_030755469.1 fibroblast growth factor receptor substrate 2 [Sitophilus oryzae]
MGCVNSKADINDTHPNLFHVINVNDRGRPVSRGKLEVTESELIFHQKGKNPIKWPLRSLRKYGWDVDTDVFSIECGRRSPTGPGYYAFKCKKAEQLFNMVQQYILGGIQESMENSNHANPLNQNTEFSVPAVLTGQGPPIQRQSEGHAVYTQNDSSHLNPTHSISRSHTGILSRPGSVSSNGGQLSPTTISPPPVITENPSLEHNNNKRNTVLVENGIGPPNYANLNPCDITDTTNHVYMNVDAKTIVSNLNQSNFVENRESHREFVEEIHSYANIDNRDVENLNFRQQLNTVTNVILPNHGDIVQMYTSNSVPCTPTIYNDTEYVMVREVNYAELDLDSNKNNSGTCSNDYPQNQIQDTKVTRLQESPSMKKKSYATIDFPKTIALSQSINPKAEMEEGSRKTRHNSTINSLSD